MFLLPLQVQVGRVAHVELLLNLVDMELVRAVADGRTVRLADQPEVGQGPGGGAGFFFRLAARPMFESEPEMDLLVQLHRHHHTDHLVPVRAAVVVVDDSRELPGQLLAGTATDAIVQNTATLVQGLYNDLDNIRGMFSFNGRESFFSFYLNVPIGRFV